MTVRLCEKRLDSSMSDTRAILGAAHLFVDVIQDAGEELCLDGQYVWSVPLVHPISDEFLEG